MTTENQGVTGDPSAEKVDELVQFFMDGGSVGDLAGFSSNEYEAIYSLAYNFMEAKKYDKAAELLKFLAVNDPVQSRWYYGLGVAEQNRGDFPAALMAYSMAAVLDAEDPLPQLQGGFCLMAMDKYREAAEALEGAVDAAGAKPGYADVLAQAKSMLETARARISRKEG